MSMATRAKCFISSLPVVLPVVGHLCPISAASICRTRGAGLNPAGAPPVASALPMTRLSSYFLPMLKEPPADAEALSHVLMVRAGLVRQLGAGMWTFLPAGWRAHRRVEQILREEMDAIGAREMLMPVLQPRELWDQTGRSEIPELFKLKDRGERPLVLAMTHEEAVTFHVSRGGALVPRPAADPLPPADQGARRAAAARRGAAHARVHHEGRLQLRPRRGGTRRVLPPERRGI